jgi:excisionase family DNA binding protein
MNEGREQNRDLVLTLKFTADLLKVSECTLRRAAAKGRYGAIRVGSQWRFRRTTIEKMLGEPIRRVV